ncbi:MAG: hypothetical protein PHG25_03860 [Candidatus Pacebacteria bacterium]|nr:hypothetical protein [Candidatus Paceibacterota bacterium]
MENSELKIDINSFIGKSVRIKSEPGCWKVTDADFFKRENPNEAQNVFIFIVPKPALKTEGTLKIVTFLQAELSGKKFPNGRIIVYLNQEHSITLELERSSKKKRKSIGYMDYSRFHK